METMPVAHRTGHAKIFAYDTCRKEVAYLSAHTTYVKNNV